MNDDEKTVRRVVGLKYDKELNGVPKVILKGSGHHADKIIEKGRQISPHKEIQDEQLLNQLYRLPVDAEIGRELFELVAMLLVHVYSIDDKYGEELK